MFVFTRWWSAVGAVVVLAGLLWIAHVLILGVQRRPGRGEEGVHPRQSGIKALVIGADRRASTSKVQVLMWTLAVLYAFVFLLVWGRSIGCDADVTAAQARRCREAATVRGVFARVLEEPLETEYYALLGLPTAAAVAAKALTVNKVGRGEVVKRSTPANEKGGIGKGLAEVVSADNGRTDLIDFQYFAFNLLALAYFATEFIASPSDGLPEIPPTLLALTGVAVAAYTGKKALETDAPTISAVVPRRVRVGEDASLTVLGAGFGAAGPPDGKLLVDGLTIRAQRWTDRKIEVDLRPDSLARLRVPPRGRAAEVSVVTAGDAASRPFAIELDRADGP